METQVKNEDKIRKELDKVVRCAIRQGEADIEFPDIDDEQVTFSAEKGREDGETSVTVEASFGDSWDGSGERLNSVWVQGTRRRMGSRVHATR
jgi:hypothetical protein